MKRFGIIILLIVVLYLNVNLVLVKGKDEKIIRIGGDYKYPPYEFVDSNGNYKGFNVDIMKSVAKECGYKVELVPLKWEDALRALEKGEVDAIQGANKTIEREGNLLFSDSYVVNEQVIFTLKETAFISSIDDLKDKKVSVQKGDIGEDIGKNINHANIITTETQRDGMTLLFNGEVDAFLGNKTVGLYFVQKEDMLKKIKITGDTLRKVDYALVTTKDNSELIKTFNNGLKTIKKNNTYTEVYKKWFGETIIYSEDAWRKVTGIIILIGSGLSIIVGIILFINKSLKVKVAKRTKELEEVNKVVEAREKKYRKFIEHCPYAMFAHNMNDEILFVNNEAKRLLKANSKKDIIGKDIKNFLGVTSYLDNIKNNREENNIYEKKFHCLDGKEIFVEVKGSIIEHDGEECIYSVITDITERKKLVEAIEDDRIKTEFIANISHELRTPLNVILASLQLMKTKLENVDDCQLKNDMNKSVTNIKSNSQRLLKLVNNLIDITKIDSGYISLNLKNGNIINVIENTTMAVVEYAQVKKIEVVFDTEFEEVIMAFDEDKVERIMLNLLSNAVKFGKVNGSIFVKTDVKDENLLITVEDDGVGIPKNKVPIIFDRFRQVDESLTRSSEGSGIGLSLVRALVDMLEGDIIVRSKYGEGTTFTIILPIVIINESEETNNKTLMSNQDMVDIEFSDIK